MLTYTLRQLALIMGITSQRIYQLKAAGHGPAQGQDGKVQTEDALAWAKAQIGRHVRMTEQRDEGKYVEGMKRLHADRVAQYAAIARRHGATMEKVPQARVYREPVPAASWGRRLARYK